MVMNKIYASIIDITTYLINMTQFYIRRKNKFSTNIIQQPKKALRLHVNFTVHSKSERKYSHGTFNLNNTFKACHKNNSYKYANFIIKLSITIGTNKCVLVLTVAKTSAKKVN